MAKITFIYGNPQRGGNSILKLLIYFHSSAQAESYYSFDGRYHQTGTKRLTDDEKYFTEDNGRRYLQKHFEDNFSHRSDLKYAAIVDSRYPTPNIKFRVWNLTTKTWTNPEAASIQLHQNHIAARTAKVPELFTFKLVVPKLKKTPLETTQWKPFYTTQVQAGYAMLDLISQFREWQKLTPSVKVQSIGQFMGKANGRFATDETGLPRFAWFDVARFQPKYHNTHRVIKEYADIQKRAQNFEELVSNYAV